MNEYRRISGWEATREAAREVVAYALAVVLFIPSVIIKLIDHMTLWWIRRRGGLN